MKTKELTYYPIFEPNQILTSTHLNQLRSFLDEENRLTRAKLSGIGIVSGLEVLFDASKKTATIQKGYGISSEGYLIAHEDTLEYVKYKKYSDPGDPYYPSWIKGKKKIDILEIFPKDAQVKETISLSSLTPKDYDSLVVVLFLEQKDEELKSCTGTSCDNKGKRRENRIRVLLIDKNDLQKVIIENVLSIKDELINLNIKKLNEGLKQIGASLETIHTVDELKKAYVFLIDEYKSIISTALKTSYQRFRFILSLSELDIAAIDGLPALNPDQPGFQYVYDHLRDLIAAYEEFAAAAHEFIKDISPSVPEFQRHLVLGELMPDKSEFIDRYRTYFINAPLFSKQDQKMLKAQILFRRILLMIKSFKVPELKELTIKITPSKNYPHALSRRTIPYYYFIPKKFGEFLGCWNPELTLQQKKFMNWSFHASDDNYGIPIPALIKEPLKYDTQEQPFYRIEGHIGFDYEKVLSELNKIKKAFNLSFGIAALKLSKDFSTVELGDELCLNITQPEYLILRSEFLCQLNFLSSAVKRIKEKKIELKFADTKQSVLQILLEKLLKLLPACLKEFNLKDFNSLLDELTQLIIQYKLNLEYNKNRLTAEKIDALSGDVYHQKIYLLDEIIDALANFLESCSAAKFVTVYQTYTWLKEYLKKNHLSIFSNFAKRFSGMEHTAGAGKGETFIIVYGDNKPGTKEANVIADFTLPYFCCCECCEIPKCDENIISKILPPVANPDYAATLKNTAVQINFIDNDLSLSKGPLALFTVDEKTSNGGLVKVLKNSSGEEVFEYNPANGFTGIDKFKYQIIDKSNELKDEATVTVLVHEKFRKEIKAIDDFASTDRKTALVIDVLANDTCFENTKLKLPKDKTKLGASIEVIEKGKKAFVKYVPIKEGLDRFDYLLIDAERKEESSAEVKVIVTCECEEAKPSCELPDLEYQVIPGGEFFIRFKEIAAYVNVTKVDTVNPEIVQVELKDAQTIFIMPRKGILEVKTYSFKYYGIDLRTNEECYAAITLIASSSAAPSVTNTFNNYRNNFNVAVNSYKYGEIKSSDDSINNNIDTTYKFINTVESLHLENPEDAAAGKLNETILSEFKKSYEPLIEEITNINKEIETGSATSDLELKKELNLNLLNSSINTFLDTLGKTGVDLKADSAVSKYISSNLKEGLTSLGDTGSVDLKSNITKLAAENSAKTNYSKLLNNIIKP